MLQNLVTWVVIGVSAGWLANHLAHRNDGNGMGVALNVIIGCIGALVGALALSLVLPKQASLSMFSPYSVLSAFVAAALFLSVARLATSLSGARSSR